MLHHHFYEHETGRAALNYLYFLTQRRSTSLGNRPRFSFRRQCVRGVCVCMCASDGEGRGNRFGAKFQITSQRFMVCTITVTHRRGFHLKFYWVNLMAPITRAPKNVPVQY